MPLPKFVRSNRIWVTQMGKTPQVTKPTKSLIKARRKALIAKKGIGALVPIRQATLKGAQEILSEKASSIFGQGVRVISSDEIIAFGKKLNNEAFKRTPADSIELKQKLLTAAKHFGEQRNAMANIKKIDSQLSALGKMKLHFATLATTSDIIKFSKLSMPKVDTGLIRRLAKENPSIKPLVRMLDSELVLGKTDKEQLELFKKAPGFGKVVRKGDGVIVVNAGGKERMFFVNFRMAKEEARRRAYAVSEVLNKLKQEREGARKTLAEKSKTNSEVLTNARPLINAYKKGEGDKNRLRGIYEEFAKADEAKELALKKATLAQRMKKLTNAKSTLEFMKGPYQRMRAANSFEEAVEALRNSEAITHTVSKQYVELLNTTPELEKLRVFEALQLMMPESKADVIETLKKRGINPKKAVGEIVIFHEEGHVYAMPTTISELKAFLTARINAINESVEIIEKMMA